MAFGESDKQSTDPLWPTKDPLRRAVKRELEDPCGGFNVEDVEATLEPFPTDFFFFLPMG